MGDTLTVSMDTSKEVSQPSLEELAAKMDEANPPEPSSEERPEWLPEKFKNAEDLAKAYGELEKKLSTRQPLDDSEKSKEAPSDKDATEVADDAEAAAKDAVKSAGLDFNELSEKYWSKGGIDDTDYAALEKIGIPRAMVDQYISGQEALVEATRQSVFSTVGGEDAYIEITSWAADNLTEPEIRAYNAAVNGNDRNAAMLAVRGLKAQFDAERGVEPSRTVKGATARAGSSSYRSIAEMEKDMGDPRYKSDPAFRKDVERKLANSNIF